MDTLQLEEYIEEWYLNSNVFEGKSFFSIKSLYKYLKKTYDEDLSFKECEKAFLQVEESVTNVLTLENKIRIAQNELSVALNNSKRDRSIAYQTLESITSEIDRISEMVEDCDEGDDFSLPNLMKTKAYYMDLMQKQQKICRDANIAYTQILEKLTNFGNGKEGQDKISRIVNKEKADQKPLTAVDLIEYMKKKDNDSILPQATGNTRIKYQDFVDKSEDHDV